MISNRCDKDEEINLNAACCRLALVLVAFFFPRMVIKTDILAYLEPADRMATLAKKCLSEGVSSYCNLEGMLSDSRFDEDECIRMQHLK